MEADCCGRARAGRAELSRQCLLSRRHSTLFCLLVTERHDSGFASCPTTESDASNSGSLVEDYGVNSLKGAVRAGAWDRLLKAVSAAYEREYVCPLSADHRFSCMAKWHVGRGEGDPTASGLYAAAQCARRLSCRASGRRCPFTRSRHSGPAIAAACDSWVAA